MNKHAIGGVVAIATLAMLVVAQASLTTQKPTQVIVPGTTRKAHLKYPNVVQRPRAEVRKAEMQTVIRQKAQPAGQVSEALLASIARDHAMVGTPPSDRMRFYTGLTEKGYKLVGWDGEVDAAVVTDYGWTAVVRFRPIVVRNTGGAITLACSTLESLECVEGKISAKSVEFQGNVNDIIVD